MIVRSRLVAALALSAFSSIFAPAARAQFADECVNSLNCPTILPFRGERIDQVFDRTFFSNDREAFRNQAFPRVLGSFFGLPGGFPENEVRRDAAAVHRLYVEVLERQNNNDPVLRTPDLPNPYNTSILQLPTYNEFNRPIRGTELYDEELPPR